MASGAIPKRVRTTQRDIGRNRKGINRIGRKGKYMDGHQRIGTDRSRGQHRQDRNRTRIGTGTGTGQNMSR